MLSPMDLKDLRLSKGLSQAELSQKAGISQHSISQMECGNQSPRPSTTRALAEALGVSTEVVFAASRESKGDAA